MPVDSAYIDTSVLSAYYCPETLSAAAENALRQMRSPVISSLSEVEFASLISKKKRLKELNGRQAREILELFGAHIAEGSYRRIALTTAHFIKACQLISAPGVALHALDALHLSIAVTENLALLTADADFVKAARRHKNPVVIVK